MKIKVSDLAWSLFSPNRMKNAAQPVYKGGAVGWKASDEDLDRLKIDITVKIAVVKSDLIKELLT